ncbi:MAG: 3'-5' exonuclease [Erysipelotrichaceae bacterium]|nr:3'-5' exonuclease [Erysipelotrichaceae bacterium]
MFNEDLSGQRGKRIFDFPSEYTVIDTETTGLSPFYCEIIELSAIKVRDDRIVDTYSRLVNPGCDVGCFITNLTGISNDMLKCEQSIEEVLPSFLEFVGDDKILGHNVTFDINFINYDTCKYYGMIFDNDYFDTMWISRRIWKEERHHRLRDLIERCHLEGLQEHRGLSDCMYTYEAYLYMKKLIESK